MPGKPSSNPLTQRLWFSNVNSRVGAFSNQVFETQSTLGKPKLTNETDADHSSFLVLTYMTPEDFTTSQSMVTVVQQVNKF